MNKPSNTQKIILVSVVALLLSFFIIILYTVPRISNLKSLSTQVAAKEAELEAGLEEVRSVRSAVQLIKTAKSDMATLGIAIPDQEKAEEALAQLGANASSSQLQIKSIAIGAGEASNIGISISTSGSFDQTMTFLSNLEKNLRPIKIANYSLSATEDASLVEASFTLLFPFLPPEPTTQSAENETGEGAGGSATEETTAVSATGAAS